MNSLMVNVKTACSVARRQRAKEKCVNVVENWSTALHGLNAEGARWLFLQKFFFFFYTILTSAGGGASAVDNFGSLRY